MPIAKRITDQDVEKSYRRTRSYEATAKELGVTKQAIGYRVRKLVQKGVDLQPPVRGAVWHQRNKSND